MKKIIILLGGPGSGKGTQAKQIANEFGYAHISTGGLLRRLASDASASVEDKKLLDAMSAGKLVSDSLIYRLAFQEIGEHLKSGKGVVLDGAIRSVTQAKEYEKFFATHGFERDCVAIEIHLSDEESLKRLIHRQVQTEGKRADDVLPIMKERIIAQGNTALAPITAYYSSCEMLQVVDGSRSIPEVFAQIKGVIEHVS